MFNRQSNKKTENMNITYFIFRMLLNDVAFELIKLNSEIIPSTRRVFQGRKSIHWHQSNSHTLSFYSRWQI